MKIIIEESVLRQALDALEEAHTVVEHRQDSRKRKKAITALRSALDAAEKVEPFAWIVPEFGFLFPTKDAATSYLRNIESDDTPTPLYTRPAPTTLVDSLAEKIAIDAREIEGWKAVADAGEKIIAARDEQIAELEEKIKQQIRFRGEALRERDELVASLKKLLSGCDTGERNPDGTQRGRSMPEKWQVDQAHAALAKLGADKTGEGS